MSKRKTRLPALAVLLGVVLCGCAAKSSSSHDPWCMTTSITSSEVSTLWSVVKEETLQFDTLHANTVRGARRRIEAARMALETGMPLQASCESCTSDSFLAPRLDGSAVTVTLVHPERPLGVLLLQQTSASDSDVSLPARYVSLLRNDVALAFVRTTSKLPSDDLIAAAREVSIRGWASPMNLFVSGTEHAASAVARRPELFRGALIDLSSPSSSVALEIPPPAGHFAAETLVTVGATIDEDELAPLFEWVRLARCESARATGVTVVSAPDKNPSTSSQTMHARDEAFILTRLLR